VLRHHGESGSCCSSEEPAQASAPVSTTAVALAGSEDSSSPHSMSDCAGRDGRFFSLSPFARGAVPAGGRAGFRCSERQEGGARQAANRVAHGREEGRQQEEDGRREKVGFGLRGIFRDGGLIVIKLEDLLAKMLENTWRRVGASGAGNADVRGGPTSL